MFTNQNQYWIFAIHLEAVSTLLWFIGIVLRGANDSKINIFNIDGATRKYSLFGTVVSIFGKCFNGPIVHL